MSKPHEKGREQGLSLTDIGPITEAVEIAPGKFVKVHGISANVILAIFQEFPEVMEWFRGGKFTIAALVSEVPGALASVIAAACGQQGDAEAIKVAGDLPVEAQLDIIDAAGRLTFKSGFGPFVSRVLALVTAAKSANYGRVPDTKSPSTSPASSRPDIPLTLPGD